MCHFFFGRSNLNEDDEDGADDEPSVGNGATRELHSQTQWGAGNRSDMEDAHDGREQDGEDEGALTGDDEPSAGFDAGEPSLGWTVDGCVTGGTGKGRWDVVEDLEISVY